MTGTDDKAFAVAELIPLALVIALSPLSIIPGILVLHTPRPRPTSLAFLSGWVLGIAAVTATFVGVSSIGGGWNNPAWSRYIRIAVGIALIVWGMVRWFTRHRSASQPKWLTAMTSLGPRRAFLTAAALSLLNVKVLFISAAAGLAIGSSTLGVTESWAAVAGFTALASSTVATPALAFLAAGDRLDAPLGRLKNWMEQNHAALIAAILVLIGVALLYKGIAQP